MYGACEWDFNFNFALFSKHNYNGCIQILEWRLCKHRQHITIWLIEGLTAIAVRRIVSLILFSLVINHLLFAIICLLLNLSSSDHLYLVLIISGRTVFYSSFPWVKNLWWQHRTQSWWCFSYAVWCLKDFPCLWRRKELRMKNQSQGDFYGIL